ncbi:hypothetical protein Agub_g11991, partial [Astrephomene gubernaculifera]
AGGGGGGVGSEALSPRPAAEAGDLLDTPLSAYLVRQEVFGAKPPGVYRPQDLDYLLIGAIIENLAGGPYDTYVRETLLDPLGVRLPPQPQLLVSGAVAGGFVDPRVTPGGSAGLLDPQATGSDVWVHVRQSRLRRAQAAAAREAEAEGGRRGGDEDLLIGASPGSDKRVLYRYPPAPLSPVGGLVLTAADAGRLLALLVQSPAAAGGGGGGGEEEGAQGQGQGGGGGRSILSAVSEIRLSDFIKDVGVAYGGLVSLGLGRCGDAVVAIESPPPPPSTREVALGGAAAAQQRRETGGDGGGGGGGGGGTEGWECSVRTPSLLLLAPESGLALLVGCNVAGPEGTAFCRK